MKKILTHKISPDQLSIAEREWVYNGLDCCVTYEVLDALLPQLDNHTASTYAFSRSLQGPVLEMRLRGILVDDKRKGEVIEELCDKLDLLEGQLYKIVTQAFGFWEFNWRSNNDLRNLFYEVLGIPAYRKGGRETVDRQAMERLESYIIARPLVRHILAMRDIAKKISVLQTEIDRDNRMRTSYNIAGTDTGRFSSSFSEFGTGTNMQNIEEILRSVFIADPGMKMGYVDAEQGESRCVGATEYNIFGDSRYLDACESGDLHTYVAKLCWPDLAWTGDSKADKDLAEQPYYRHFSRRFMCKKLGHGSNYGGRPRTLADQTRTDIKIIEEFQPQYFKAFPAHQRWHEHVKNEIYTIGKLTTLTGRKRQFWGRRDSDETVRAAIAYDPQGSLADIVNHGMLKLWRERAAILLLQVHDAIVFQFPEDKEDEIIPRVVEILRTPIELKGGRQFVIPYGCKTGWNFGIYSENNPDGLKEYPGDKRTRES